MILTIVFWILALGGAGALWLALEFSPWWLLLLVPASYVGVVIVYFMILAVMSFFWSFKDPEKTSRFARDIIRISLDWIFRTFGLDIRAEGLESLPSCPCVIVSNHRSMFDPLVLLVATKRRDLVFLSKVENFKIPVVGGFMRRGGFLAVDRGNGMKALRSLKRGADKIKEEGLDFGVYPEGTRSRTGKLLRFKTGAFYLAQKAETPVAVVATVGTEDALKYPVIKKKVIRIEVCDVLPKEKVQALSMEELAEKCKEMIASKIAEIDPKHAETEIKA